AYLEHRKMNPDTKNLLPRAIESATLVRLPSAEIESVTFYKRDEITTDLICCDVKAGGQIWSFDEETEGWDLLLEHLEHLPRFPRDWYASIVEPPFATNMTVAFKRD